MCITGLRWLSRDFSKIALFLFSCFFWFFTYYHCRFSSENSAGIAFFAGFALALWTPLSMGAVQGRQIERNIRFAFAGLLFGFSFFFRFQMGIAIFGIGLWLLIFRKASFGELFYLFTAFCLGCTVNIGIDRWFYGVWVLTPVNYYVVNIVQGVSNQFGVSPWWYFIGQLFLNLAPPYSLVILSAVFVSWYKCPKNPLVWVSVPFFLLHCAVSHKEFRFLFPMIYAFPALLVLGVDALRPSIIVRLHRISLNKAIRIFIIVYIGVNMVLLLGYSFKPGRETIKIYQWIYKKGIQGPFSLLTVEQSPYILSGYPLNYYRPPNVNIVKTHTADSLKAAIKASKGPAFVWTRTFAVPDSLVDKSAEWKVECRSMPQWLKYFDFNHWLSRVRVWTIYSVKYPG
jgi:GPI mannosyltransferase 3